MTVGLMADPALRTAKRLQKSGEKKRYLLSLIPSGISGGGALIRLWLFP